MRSYKASASGKSASPMRIVIPALLLMLAFVLVVIHGVLPLVESRMLASKKAMVRELVQTARQTLVYFHDQEAQGRLPRAEAQQQAIRLLQGMRYGPENKDYFWINNFTPTLIMHPYRPDLVGHNVADYTDPSGKFLFREMVRIARDKGGGFVDYMWQRKDDPHRIVPKISYVAAFKPWGWILGSGIYIEDVRAEIAALSHRLIMLSGALLLLLITFSGYYVWQWSGTEKRRREAWQALAESREKYMTVLESSPNAVVVYDNQGRVLYFNPAFIRIFGWELKELIGQPIDFVPEDCREETRQAIAKAFKDGHFAFESQRRRKDGKVLHVQIHAATYRLANGSAGGLVVNLEDISERKKTEAALRQSEEKYRLLTESISETIWTMDLSYNFTYVSPASRHILGWTAKEILTCNLQAILPEAEHQKALAALAQMVADGERTGDYPRSRTLELEFRHKSGDRVWTEVTATIMVDKEGRPDAILGVTRDVSKRKQAEAERLELLEKLARSRKMEALGLLAGGVAHDLNNVLSGIVSYPDLMLMDLPADSPLVASVMTIKESGLKAAAIVQDLLTLARRGITAFEVLSLNDIVSDVMRSPEYQKLIGFHPDVDFQVVCEPNLPNMEGSPIHLKKTILNLIANAAEAQPGGGLVRITTESRYVDKPLAGYEKVAEGEYILLRVADHGHGIAEEDLARIFEPFYTKKVLGRSGTGLGMAVVWGTVQDHKGYIDIQSETGQGTVFELYFPMSRKARQDHPVPSQDTIRGRNESILVVDDIQEQREIASRILSRLNYAVTTVSSGEKAVAFLKANAVDLVILDMIMDPGMDGLDTYREIVAIRPAQKVIIASGYAETERVKTALDLGVGQYLKKPYTLEKIGMVVRGELDRSTVRRV